jgi:predicted  nucleic acid-binding Zn-ribbon protein
MENTQSLKSMSEIRNELKFLKNAIKKDIAELEETIEGLKKKRDELKEDRWKWRNNTAYHDYDREVHNKDGLILAFSIELNNLKKIIRMSENLNKEEIKIKPLKKKES